MSREGRSDDKLVCTGQGDVVNQIRSVIPLARVRAQAPLLSPRACRATPSLTRDGPVEGRRVRAHAARRMDIAHTPPQKPYLKHDSQSVSIHVSSTPARPAMRARRPLALSAPVRVAKNLDSKLVCERALVPGPSSPTDSGHRTGSAADRARIPFKPFVRQKLVAKSRHWGLTRCSHQLPRAVAAQIHRGSATGLPRCSQPTIRGKGEAIVA